MKLKSCLRMLASLRLEASLISNRETGKLLSLTPVIVSGFPSGGIVLHAGKCEGLSQCVLIFASIYGAHSLLCTLIIVHSGGCRSFATVMSCWLLGQFSVSFEYRPGTQHANADGLSRQCGQCPQPDCPVSSQDVGARETGSTSDMLDQPFPRRKWVTLWILTYY